MLQISSFPVCSPRLTTLREGSEWFTFPCSVPTVTARQSSKQASKPMGPSAITVKTSSAHGGSFSYSTRTGAVHQKFAVKWSTWLLMAAGSATPPVYCGLARRQ